jgi:hypothetical protein
MLKRLKRVKSVEREREKVRMRMPKQTLMRLKLHQRMMTSHNYIRK